MTHTLAAAVLHDLAERACYAADVPCVAAWPPEGRIFVPQVDRDVADLSAVEARLDGTAEPEKLVGVRVTRDHFLDGLLLLRDAGLVLLDGNTYALPLNAIREAIRIRPSWSSENVTRFWIARKIPELNGKILGLLSRSSVYVRKEEILHTYLTALMARDGLRSGLLRGMSPSPSQIAAWALKTEHSAFLSRSRDALSWCETVSILPPQTAELAPAFSTVTVDYRSSDDSRPVDFGGAVFDLSVSDGRDEVQNLLLYGERQLEGLAPLLKRVNLQNSDLLADRSVDSVISEGLHLNRRAVGTLRDLSRTPDGLPIRDTSFSKLLINNGWVEATPTTLRITPKGRSALVGWDDTDPFYALRT